MTELARSPRRIEHARENSDKLFHDLFANSQKPLRDDSGYPRVPWKDRKLPASFFHPPPPTDSFESQPPPSATQFSNISHAYSRSTPAINFAPSRPMYPRQQPAANLWGPSTLPEANNGSISQQNEFIQSDGQMVKEIHSLPPAAAQEQYNIQSMYAPTYEARSQQYYQQQLQPSAANYQHIHHSRQASLPYSHPRLAAANNHRFGGTSLKQQQSKPAADWWPAQPSPQQYTPQVSNTTATVGPACQHWSTTVPQQQSQWQQQETAPPDATIFATPAPTNRSLPVVAQNYSSSNEWPSSNNSWPSTSEPSNIPPDVIVVSEQSSNQTPQDPEVLDDQRQQLLFFAARLREERDRMKAKIDELEKKLEDVMAALTVSGPNGFYTSASVSSNPDDLVPSLQIGDQGNSVVGPQLENGNGNSPSSWM